VPGVESNAADSGSFRDRDGRVYHSQGRVFRGLSQEAVDAFRQLQETRFYREFRSSGRIVESRDCIKPEVPLPPQVLEKWAGFIEHQPIRVISYPYEWTFGMLRDAALLQLDLMEAALGEGMSLKDATPYNVQFQNCKPIFIDIASFIPLESGSTWAGYRQFCEMFLFPLFVQAYKKMDFQPFLRAGIDGIPVQTAARIFGLRDWLRAGVFSHVWLQARLDRRYGATQKDVRSEIRSAGFSREMVLANLRRLRKLIRGLHWQGEGSQWGAYEAFHNYSAEDHALKAEFIESCVAASKPGVLWDIGCNTGQFSRLAARHASAVVALDFDHFAVERLYRAQRESAGGNILPLVQNIANPSPNWGWRNRERTDLQSRAAPDFVLALALIHHVVISANIPLEEFISWLASFTPELVIEFVAREDDKVKSLLRNRDDPYEDYSREGLEHALQAHFNIVKVQSLESGNRHLYWCKRHPAG